MNKKILPTVTSVMWHPTPELRNRWIKEYGKDRFSFDEAREAQTFPKNWIFPPSESKRWKWLGEAFPPKVAEYLFNMYISGNNNVLLDLFAGIGGWGLGAVWSGKFRKIIMVEINREKCRYLDINFQRLGISYEIICDDVRNVDYTKIKADVISASPPCEDLSMLRYFSNNTINRGTVPLTIVTINIVDMLKPKIALYENVYRLELVKILERYGWKASRFDMSKLIPQKRVRLIAIKKNW